MVRKVEADQNESMTNSVLAEPSTVILTVGESLYIAVCCFSLVGFEEINNLSGIPFSCRLASYANFIILIIRYCLEVIKPYSCSTQLRMKFVLLIDS